MSTITQQSATVGGSGKGPKVSIVLPVYNSENELSAVLLELDRQSYREREIVIVDDGSTDGTWNAANSLSTGREDMTLVHTEHRGASHARNAGVEKATGEIIFFAESDCVYDETYLQKAVDSLDSHPEAGAVCLTGAPLITRSTLATQSIDIENKMQHALLNQGRSSPFYAWVYRREALVKLGGFDEKLFQGEDKDLFSRLKKANYAVAWVPGVNWRHRRDQTTASSPGSGSRAEGRASSILIKHRRVLDILKTMAPFWADGLGAVLLLRVPLIFGGIDNPLRSRSFSLIHTLRVVRISWPSVAEEEDLPGLPDLRADAELLHGDGILGRPGHDSGQKD